MLTPPRMLAFSSVMAVLLATTACSPSREARVECGGSGSVLTSIDARTGAVDWQTSVRQASEVPLRIEDGSVLVTGPCGAAVVGLRAGKVRYDATTTGEPVGVAGGHLFIRDDTSGEEVDIGGIDLPSGRSDTGFSTNLALEDATVAGGRLVTFYGDELAAYGQNPSGPTWQTQIPVYRTPQLLAAGHLVLVTGGDGSTYAVDLRDGAVAWRTVPPVLATFYAMSLTPVPGTVLTTALRRGPADVVPHLGG